jgi:hypothetical protein
MLMTKFLLIKRTDNGKWAAPGGHLHKKEGFMQGALRELREETGITAKPEDLHLIDLKELDKGGIVAYYHYNAPTTYARADGVESSRSTWTEDPWAYDLYGDALDKYRAFYAKDYPTEDGGPGSGNFNHAGRPGKVGGSAPQGGVKSLGYDGKPTAEYRNKAMQLVKRDYTAAKTNPKTVAMLNELGYSDKRAISTNNKPEWADEGEEIYRGMESGKVGGIDSYVKGYTHGDLVISTDEDSNLGNGIYFTNDWDQADDYADPRYGVEVGIVTARINPNARFLGLERDEDSGRYGPWKDRVSNELTKAGYSKQEIKEVYPHVQNLSQLAILGGYAGSRVDEGNVYVILDRSVLYIEDVDVK